MKDEMDLKSRRAKRIIRHANLKSQMKKRANILIPFHPSSALRESAGEPVPTGRAKFIPHPLLASYADSALRYRHHGRVRVAEKVDEQKWQRAEYAAVNRVPDREYEIDGKQRLKHGHTQTPPHVTFLHPGRVARPFYSILGRAHER